MSDDWIAALRARAELAPVAPRDPLHVGAQPIGSIEPSLAQRLLSAGLPIVAGQRGWVVVGTETDVAFERIARWLHENGLASAWRDELLAVDDANGARVGLIERAAVRPLGIATRAVHLIGWAEQGRVWVQQRALDKATDPGQWDTLMGGLMAGDESIAMTLERETWEEAGLRLDALRNLVSAREFTVRRPVREGYMVERIHVHEALVPNGVEPCNQDGEVAAFECVSLAELNARLRAGSFTLEASLILIDALARR